VVWRSVSVFSPELTSAAVMPRSLNRPVTA
jgi:hypothetical protein